MKLLDLLKENLDFDLPKKDINEPSYMVTQNLKQIVRQANEILELDEKILLDLMNKSPWAVDHLSTSKDDIEEVYNYVKTKSNIIPSSDNKGQDMDSNEDL